MGLGNHLYLYLWAWGQRRCGVEAWVLRRPGMDAWFEHFPHLEELLIDERSVGFLDRRELNFAQAANVDFQVGDLPAFITAYLGSVLVPRPADGSVVVNVRRGDYYSNAVHRQRYGFNVAQYVRAALQGLSTQAPVTSVEVISDDPAWCRDSLAWLADEAPVVFADRIGGPYGDFVRLAQARRLVLANSTFSYWGGYVSNALYGTNHADVWAPWFHSRTGDNHAAYQLDPRWSVVTDIEGGWGEVDE